MALRNGDGGVQPDVAFVAGAGVWAGLSSARMMILRRPRWRSPSAISSAAARDGAQMVVVPHPSKRME